MNQVFIFLLISILICPIYSQAIVHVGNGGGDAELELNRMLQSASVWNKAMLDNPNIFWSNAIKGYALSKALKEVFQNNQRIEIDFFYDEIKDFKCDKNNIWVNGNRLYKNRSESLTQSELNTKLIYIILSCQSNINVAQFDDTFVIKEFSSSIINTEIGLVSLLDRSILLSLRTNQNLDSDIKNAIDCHNYLYQGINNQFINMSCIDNKQNYLVKYQLLNNKIIISPRLASED